MPAVLVSACLAGRKCRYDGADKNHPTLVAALEREGLEPVLFCPEEAGGLGTPRPAAKIEAAPDAVDAPTGADVLAGAARVVTEDGADVTEEFVAGARGALAAAQEHGCTTAFLTARSPSCGCAHVHTTRGLTSGRGVTAALLAQNGIALVDVDG